ncbi:MAG: RdgB/HAM1 family non-canonical purine NTP pyrophosphatase [Gammaproteobacteria bacterium]|nr:RdgB/HAM1 family non-canonical purine NTP pyrophosphatase [Gammaproteobacteria bacterium]
MPAARRVVLATGNAGKLVEMRAILAPHALDVVAQAALGVTPPEETGTTFADNALLKARHAAQATGLPAIADDSGLEVDALDGRPGVYSARYAGPGCSDEDNNARLLAELAGIPAARRSARYRCAMAFVRDANDPAPIVCQAAWEGAIGFERRGSGGFGYDPLFIVAGGTQTAAEMPAAAKNAVSHRGQALQALAAAMLSAGW